MASSPELAALTGHVRTFAAIMTGRRGRELEQWMTAAAASVEGLVNRIKMLKRQMNGRANPDLLRLRVLLAD